MGYKVILGFVIFPYLIAFIVTGLAELTNDPASITGSNSAFASFIDLSAQPEEVNIEEPTLLNSDTPVSTGLSFPKTPIGWAGFLFRTTTLTGPIWKPWTLPFRFILVTINGFIVAWWTKDIWLPIASGIIGGIFGRRTP